VTGEPAQSPLGPPVNQPKDRQEISASNGDQLSSIRRRKEAKVSLFFLEK